MKSWLQPPRLRIGEENEGEHRNATWLEHFYDLVYVVAVFQLAHNLSENVSLTGFLGFVVLFLPIWWLGLAPRYMPTASIATRLHIGC